MNTDDLKLLDSYDLIELRSKINEELAFRKSAAAPKKPIFVFDGGGYKNLDTALDRLKDKCEYAKKFKNDGAYGYFSEPISRGANVPILLLSVRFEPQLDYDQMADIVYGY